MGKVALAQKCVLSSVFCEALDLAWLFFSSGRQERLGAARACRYVKTTPRCSVVVKDDVGGPVLSAGVIL
jgi:hypothetical protein